MSEQKTDLALQVTVKNRNGDDAHEAKLVGSFPESLSYSGFRSHNPTVSADVGMWLKGSDGDRKVASSIPGLLVAECRGVPERDT